MKDSIEGQSYLSWISAEFLLAALKKEEPSGIDVIESVSVKRAGPEGSGYSSLMYRVTVSGREKGKAELTERRLLVKCSVNQGQMKAESDKAGVFKIESLALGGVMPEMHRVLAAAEGDAFRPLTAHCFLCGDHPAAFLVLEDLAAAGFSMAEADKPLDYEHCAAVVKALARFHAASARVLRDHADYKERLSPDPLNSVRDYIHQLAGSTFRAVADQLRASPDYSKYADRYLRVTDATADRMLEARRDKDVQLLVMLHGDCWMNNVMFKYDAGKVADLRFVDFQLSTTGSPAVDLQHLLYSSASEEVHRRHLDGLLSLYHDTLQSTLRALSMAAEADAYPLDKFLQEFDRAAAVGLFYSTFNVVFLSSGALGAEISKLFNDSEYPGEVLAKAYANPYSLSYIKYLTPLFEKKGLL